MLQPVNAIAIYPFIERRGAMPAVFWFIGGRAPERCRRCAWRSSYNRYGAFESVSATALRVVPRQQLAHRADALQRALLETPRAECAFHGLADRLPLRRRNPRGNAAIGHDLDVAIGQQQIDQTRRCCAPCPTCATARTPPARARARPGRAHTASEVQRGLDHQKQIWPPCMPRFAGA
jgi:hypothetical protein